MTAVSPLPKPPVAAPDAVRVTRPVLGAPIDAITSQQAIQRISAWAGQGRGRVVCICNVHSVVTASQDARFMEALAQADMATPDGAPVAWMLRRQGIAGQRRVSGPDLMWDYCAHAQAAGESIFLLGSTPETLAALQQRLLAHWPALRIAGTASPPFRPLTAAEEQALADQINTSGAGTVWVSLGCPKQELWMAAQRQRVHAVMVGVGAAFDFHAGRVSRAPAWMRDHGLEWLHRLCSEPGRLWKRYLTTNTAFVILAAWQLLRRRDTNRH